MQRCDTCNRSTVYPVRSVSGYIVLRCVSCVGSDPEGLMDALEKEGLTIRDVKHSWGERCRPGCVVCEYQVGLWQRGMLR